MTARQGFAALDAAVERRLLQAAVALGALLPITAGFSGVVSGTAMIGTDGVEPALDSHYRYLSGLLFAIGLGFWSTVPHIETRAVRFRLLTFLVLVGGLARAWSLLRAGVPAAPMLGALAMELLVTPLLCLWQARVAQRTAGAASA